MTRMMLKNLKENEIKVATKLIDDGLSMAVCSMEQILQSPITILKIDYGIDHLMPNNLCDKKDENIYVLKTDLTGEMEGSCHLIFSEKEVLKIFNTCLPYGMASDDSVQSKMLKDGFLSEIKNIVAGAVITDFSNLLDIDMYGQVPEIKILAADRVNEYLITQSNDLNEIIHFKAIFHGSELEISPDFIWIFDLNEFVDKIKEIS